MFVIFKIRYNRKFNLWDFRNGYVVRKFFDKEYVVFIECVYYRVRGNDKGLRDKKDN